MSNYDNEREMWGDIASSADPGPMTPAQRREMERSKRRNPNIDPDEQAQDGEVWA